MIERYLSFLGEKQTIQYLKANEKPLKPFIRVNTLKIKPKDLKERLTRKGFLLSPTQWVPYAFEVKQRPYNLGSSHEFLQGLYYLQNLASMLPAQVLNPQLDEIIIDMCASPGSKSTQLAQLMGNQGKLILIEKYKNRIPSLSVNLRRMGVLNSILLQMDAIKLENLNIKADKILLDAPCTGEGLIREDNTRKKSKSLKELQRMSQLQRLLLKSGLASLKPDGILLYSTCSIAPEENELVIDDVLKNHSQYRIINISRQYGVEGLTEYQGKELNTDLKLTQRLYPHLQDTIGFFICLIKKFK